MEPLRIGFVASEVVPFAKTGGLADVASALPRFLRASGHDVRVVLPRYDTVDLSGVEVHAVEVLRDVPVPIEGRKVRFDGLSCRLPGSDLQVVLVDCPTFFHRGRPYTSDPDEAIRFAYLSRAAIEIWQRLGFSPDVAHVHDWHTALVPLYLKTVYGWDALFRRTRSVLTIHNLAYQGMFPASVLPAIGLSEHRGLFHRERLERGAVNFLETGILHADRLTTVSRTYAHEITTPELGEGLDDLLRARKDALEGIVNGVDYASWSPERDPHLARRYSRDDLDGKRDNKRALRGAVGLPDRGDAPVLGMVSRLAPQKGIELCYDVLPGVLSRHDVQLVVLGSGGADYERFFEHLAHRFHDRVRYFRGFNEPLAHMIEAGADAFLMPSKFEPCGLNQMYSLRYGTIPIVRRTGGLADTVTPFDPETGEGDGVVFEHFSAGGLRWAIEWALALYRRPEAWRAMMRNGMAKDFSWDVQGTRYLELYERLVGRPVAKPAVTSSAST